jgi:curved DNA-binding protein CbpA
MVVEEYYKILELKPNASQEEIKQAYRNLVKTWHPDLFHNDPQMKQQAEAKIKIINHAYEELKSYSPPLTSQKYSTKVTNNSSKVSTKLTEPEFFYQKGIRSFEKKLYNDAIYYFSKAIDLDRKYIEAYEYRAKVKHQLGHKYQAKVDFQYASKLKLEILEQNQLEIKKQKKRQIKEKQAASLEKYQITIENNFTVVSCIIISKIRKIFVSGSWGKKIELRQLDTGRVIYSLGEHLAPVNCLCISADEKLVVTGSKDKTIKLWDLEKGELIHTFGDSCSGHLGDILSVAISHNSKMLISGSADKTIKTWDIATGKELYIPLMSFSEIK